MNKKNLFALFIFLIGLGLFLYPTISHYVNDYSIHKEIEEFQLVSAEPLNPGEKESLWKDMEEYNDSLIGNENNAVQDAFTEEVVASNPFYQVEDGEKPIEAEIDADQTFDVHSSLASSPFYFVIRIPKINVELPIYMGASDQNLLKGAAQITGTSLPLGGANTHSVIAGHRGTLNHRMFLDLNKLGAGDTFEIQTLDGLLTYRVTGSKVVYPNEVDTLQIKEGKDLVTLVTCLKYPMNYKRLLVYGERVD
ncbi:class C sortase, partial [Lacticigenium naphthae]|uniref:class C sortase n=1 Tax=Lacticigenium naphthae TaxID=515351 RepID=UPI000407DCB5